MPLTDVFVACGVAIGEGYMMSSRSSVYLDLPPMMVCVDSPTKPIKSIIINSVQILNFALRASGY